MSRPIQDIVIDTVFPVACRHQLSVLKDHLHDMLVAVILGTQFRVVV